MFGTTEIILIVAALFLLFGASRLPKLAKSLGQSRKAFKEGMDEMQSELNDESSKPSSIEAPKIKEVKDPNIAPDISPTES